MTRSTEPSTLTEASVPPPSASFWRVARRGKWIGVLLLALVLAASFAALGRWQLERSIRTEPVQQSSSEQAVPLTSVTKPQEGVTERAAGQVVTASGTLVAADSIVLTGREGGGGPGSAWLVGHVVTDDGASLAVALGWADSAADARAAAPVADERIDVLGRYLPSESPDDVDAQQADQRVLSTADLVNRWPDVRTVYSGYVVSHREAPGLQRIDSPAPVVQDGLNLLNLFYAIEWAVFAGFAVFLWYRLVRDEQEKEAEEAAEAAGASVDAPAEGDVPAI